MRDDFPLIREIGESSKVFDDQWPTTPETVPIDVAARAAEMAYRRGVQQGACFMLWHLRGGGPSYQPGQPGEEYESKIREWRERGHHEQYGRAEEPPRS